MKDNYNLPTATLFKYAVTVAEVKWGMKNCHERILKENFMTYLRHDSDSGPQRLKNEGNKYSQNIF